MKLIRAKQVTRDSSAGRAVDCNGNMTQDIHRSPVRLRFARFLWTFQTFHGEITSHTHMHKLSFIFITILDFSSLTLSKHATPVVHSCSYVLSVLRRINFHSYVTSFCRFFQRNYSKIHLSSMEIKWACINYIATQQPHF